MNRSIDHFFEQLKGHAVAIIGIGVSHTELIRLFAKKGIPTTVCDKRTAEQIGELAEEFRSLGVTLSLGEDYLDNMDVDMVIRTPGMYFYHPFLQRCREEGIVVTSEMELFFDLCPARIIAVTGSDGKTTTTTLISEMLKHEGYTVHLGGNIGKPMLSSIEQIKPEDFAVVELSSFQLISMRQSPDIAVVTNVAPNHLDVHGTMEEYIAAKQNILLHQNAFSRTVLNADNEITQSFVPLVRGELYEFSASQPVRRGAFLSEDGMVFVAHEDGISKIMPKEFIRIPGMHNVENYLTAISAIWGLVSIETIVDVAKTFGGVEHRIEFVRELDGVRYYNDSIATSPTRTIAGLNAFDQKLIVIAGGYDKKIPYLPLAPKLIEKAKVLILMGATGPKIEDCVSSYSGFAASGLQILHADSMEDAVIKARAAAQQGDIVTLSPASASFDLYRNFEERGIHYKNIVSELI